MLTIDLRERHAVVGGASRGIGAATARALAACGASVTLLARSEEHLQRTLASLATSEGQQHGYRVVDYADPAAVVQALGALCERTDILVHNSGGPAAGPLLEASGDALRDGFTQHVLTGQALVQAVVAGMQARGHGRIVNVISTSVKEPIPGLGVSNTIRGAVASWAKTLARELAPHGITVNNVLPGFTRTERLDYLFRSQAEKAGRRPEEIAHAALATVPAGRFAEPEETAAAIAFLASPLAAYVNGINLPVDGARTASL